MKNLLDLLKNNRKIPMHMPGHKRNTALAPYLKCLGADIDITEIDGFDNLHNSAGVLKKAMEKAAKLRGADSAFYLINGTTCGILASVCAILEDGDKAIVARNCHKSVYNAIELARAKPVFVPPKICNKTGLAGEIDASDIERKIKENPDAKVVIITSPTYEGIVSDILKISKICEIAKIPLMVDAAHGAHFGFGYGFPEDAVTLGADIVVESLHKTLPSLTQTGICYAKKEYAEKISDKLAVFETSSPSYILMASIDGCVSLLAEKSDEIFSVWQENLQRFYEKCEKLKNISVLKDADGAFDRDIGKIVLFCENGKWLFDELRKKGIECEMASCSYVLAMTGPGDTEEMLSYFAASLLDIDKSALPKKDGLPVLEALPEQKMSVYAAKKREAECVNIADAKGRISAEYVWAYPPGIPIVIPGECIGDAEIAVFKQYEMSQIELFGSGKTQPGKILVIK